MWKGQNVGVDLGKEAETEEVIKAAVVFEKKDVLVHETEISVASIGVQEWKEEAFSIPGKRRKELEDLQAGVKYHKIYCTKNAKTEDEGETITKKKRRMISKLVPNLLSGPTNIRQIIAPKKIVDNEKDKKNSHLACMMTFMHT